MKKLAVALTIICFTGCSAVDNARYGQKSETPMPTDPLTSIASYSTKAGSYQIAFEQAEKFCVKWRATPSVISKQLKYNGQITEGANTAINTAEKIADSAGAWIPGISNKDAYETTLTYKCY